MCLLYFATKCSGSLEMMDPRSALRFRPFQYFCNSPNIRKFMSSSLNEFLQQRLLVLLLLDVNLTCVFVVWS